MQIERRNFEAVELRVETREDGQRMIRGHAAVFNELSENLGGFREKIEPGAFAGSIGKDDIRALWNHNADVVLGRNRSGTLRLAEDAKGLVIEIDPPDTQAARDLMVSMERGDITQMSFGFRVDGSDGESWKEDEEGRVVRTLKKVRLFDVSPVTFPAYPQTDVAARSMQTWQAEKTEERASVAAQSIKSKRLRLELTELE